MKKTNSGRQIVPVRHMSAGRHVFRSHINLLKATWMMVQPFLAASYGRTKTVLLCTESFTKEECIILQSLLEKLNIKSTLKVRDKINNRYRIRISKTSMDIVISLVKPYMHKDFLYKLGL